MTEPTNLTAAPTGTGPLDADALATLARQLGINITELAARLGGGAAAPTVKQHITDYLAAQTKNTRRTYATTLYRLRDGIGPVCDQQCEPCMDRDSRFRCQCECAACASSRLTVPPLGDRTVSADVYSETVVKHLTAIARRMGRKSGIVDNRGRAARGLPSKIADGSGAEETAVGALRSLFKTATKWTGGVNAALETDKPRRHGKERRPLQPFELLELAHVTATTGNDPELDRLILDFGIATGARRSGVYQLTVGQLAINRQIVHLRDKYDQLVEAPVSAELIGRLAAHAIERGGARCDPSSRHYVPDSPVFYVRWAGQYLELTTRRFDQLHLRWQQNLPWAMEEQVGFHHIRHSISGLLASHYGPQYKKRYLRHADGNVTDGYGICTLTELARAMSDLLGFEHPLVHGVEQRRQDTLRRLGLTSE